MTSGLVRRPHYEEVLAAAIKDKESKHGISSVSMQRFATESKSPKILRPQGPWALRAHGFFNIQGMGEIHAF